MGKEWRLQLRFYVWFLLCWYIGQGFGTSFRLTRAWSRSFTEDGVVLPPTREAGWERQQDGNCLKSPDGEVSGITWWSVPAEDGGVSWFYVMACELLAPWGHVICNISEVVANRLIFFLASFVVGAWFLGDRSLHSCYVCNKHIISLLSINEIWLCRCGEKILGKENRVFQSKLLLGSV